jgi:hypothetical protein
VVGVHRIRIGQWYVRQDKGETFQITGYDHRTRMIAIQTFDGDLDEIDEAAWRTLPLAWVEPPEDWTGPIDDVEIDDLDYSATGMTRQDWSAPLQPFNHEQEAWEDPTAEEEIDGHTERLFPTDLIPDEPEGDEL